MSPDRYPQLVNQDTQSAPLAHQNGDFGGEFLKLIADRQLLAARTVFISEGVSSRTAKQVVTDLLVLDSINNDPIYLYLNSPGGEETRGHAIYDTIR
jgi:ATP-dependent protease ClpP protease subunit